MRIPRRMVITVLPVLLNLLVPVRRAVSKPLTPTIQTPKVVAIPVMAMVVMVAMVVIPATVVMVVTLATVVMGVTPVMVAAVVVPLSSRRLGSALVTAVMAMVRLVAAPVPLSSKRLASALVNVVAKVSLRAQLVAVVVAPLRPLSPLA